MFKNIKNNQKGAVAILLVLLIIIGITLSGCFQSVHFSINIIEGNDTSKIILKKYLITLPGNIRKEYHKKNNSLVKAALTGNWEKSLSGWKEIIESGISDPVVHYNLALSLEVSGRVKEAEKEYLKACNIAPGRRIFQNGYMRLLQDVEDK